MNKEGFAAIMAVMADAFHAPGIDKRVRALYEFFQNEGEKYLILTARECARTMDRFPSPAAFGDVLSRVKAQHSAGKHRERHPCNRCRGDGRVIYYGEDGVEYVAACPCPNGAPFSKSHIVWQQEFGELLGVKDRLKRSPHLFSAGLEYLKEIGVKVPKSVEDKIKEAVASDDSVPF